jgi:hypothetical protein
VIVLNPCTYQEAEMPVPMHHTDPGVAAQLPLLVAARWTTEVVPQLPAAREAQARTLKAFQRKRGLQSPTDVLRGSSPPFYVRAPGANGVPGP